VTFLYVFMYYYSVETQHTIGYGRLAVTEECASGVILLCLQSIVGVILEGLIVGLVFLKISRPKKRSESLAFSKHALIGHRDGKKYFMFRVCDTRAKSHLLEAHVRAQLVRKRVTAEGELITHSQEELKVGGEGEKEDKILLFWPTTVVHEIDKDSPLWDLQPKDLHSDNMTFEIIVVLEGVLETTGLMAQARSSYAPYEIRWGSRFREMSYSKSSSGHRIMDYTLFDEMVSEESPTPQY
jgi:potassium inwardly-rectifying channel subfamily J